MAVLLGHPELSYRHRLYLIHDSFDVISAASGETTSIRLDVLPSRGIVVELSPIRSLAADFRFASV